MEKSFFYPVPWPEIGYLKEALNAMEVPYTIEQADSLPLDPGDVAFVFPSLPVRVYSSIQELFGSHGKAYPHD